VWAWGRGIEGQLGDNNATQSDVPVQVLGIGGIGFLDSVLAIAGGVNHSMSIVAGVTGSPRVWGFNDMGQLGDLSNTQRDVPVSVTGLSNIGTISASFTPASGTVVCMPPGTITFTNTGSSGVGITHFWDAGPVLVTYSSAGAKNVTLVNSRGCATCTDTATAIINVIDNAQAGFTSTAPACVMEEVNFYNSGSSGTGVTHLWTFGADAIPGADTAENPVNIVYSSSGAKTITHSVTVGSCVSTTIDTNVITINPNPSSAFSTTATSTSKCAGDTVSFTNLGTSGPGISHAWDLKSSTGNISKQWLGNGDAYGHQSIRVYLSRHRQFCNQSNSNG